MPDYRPEKTRATSRRTQSNGHAPVDEPPTNVEAERLLLASLFALPDAFGQPEVSALSPDDFWSPEHRVIYRHLLGLWLAGNEPSGLPARLNAAGEYEAAGGPAAITALLRTTVTGADARYYADLIREAAELRWLWQLQHTLGEHIRDRLPAADIFGLLEATAEKKRVADNRDSAAPTCRELYRAYPALRPHIIHGLLREGETMNCIAAPKVGKSWLAIGLALCVVTGKRWLGTYATSPGKVLIVDNELHHETIAHRIPKVADALGIGLDDYADNLRVQSLRGQLRDIDGLGKLLLKFSPGQFKLVVVDAFYRCLPRGVDENSNADVAQLYNTIDRYADRLKCGFVLIHHASKGNQSNKQTTDIGAGAGSQSRATDTHLVLRPHRDPEVVVLEAAARSWPPVEPICLRWKFPAWTVDEKSDPADLKSDRRSVSDNQRAPDISSHVEKLRRAMERRPDGETKSVLKSESGLRTANFDPAINFLLDAGEAEACEIYKSGKKTPLQAYRLTHPDATRTPPGR